jgi:hypothetical protein
VGSCVQHDLAASCTGRGSGQSVAAAGSRVAAALKCARTLFSLATAQLLE